MSTYPSDNTKGFASILYVIFCLEKKFEVKEIAKALGISQGTLYSYLEGYRVFPPDLIAPLYLATRERRFLSFFLDECNVAFHELPDVDQIPDVEMVRRMVEMQKAVVKVLDEACDD